MHCKDCNRTMILWCDDKYHCPGCDKEVDRPDEEFSESCFNCFWRVVNWCGSLHKMIDEVPGFTCPSWDRFN